MSGERLARASLALDAVYCVVTGVLGVMFRARLGGVPRLPAVVVAVPGLAAAGSSAVLLDQAVRIDWRRGIKEMTLVNMAAAALMALAAALHPVRGARSPGIPGAGRRRPRGRASGFADPPPPAVAPLSHVTL